MKKKSGNTIAATPADDICTLAESLNAGDELALAPGVYHIERSMKIENFATIRSATNNAEDVAIVRVGGPVLVIDGDPCFIENLTLISAPRPVGVSDDQDEVYDGCVAIYGGCPTFVYCRVASAEQNGVFVNGSDTGALFFFCELRRSGGWGACFSGGAFGTFNSCTIADNALGGVYAEQTEEEGVKIVQSKLYRGAAPIYVHDGGRVQAEDCEIASNAKLGNLVRVEDGVFEAKSCRFFGLSPITQELTWDQWKRLTAEDASEAPECALGVGTENAEVRLTDCQFERLVSAFQNKKGSTSLTMTRCKVVDGVESVLIDPNSPKPVFDNCRFFKEPIVDSQDEQIEQNANPQNCLREVETKAGEPFAPAIPDKEELDQKVDRTERAIQAILGAPKPQVVETGETDLCGFVYPNSTYGGTFVVSQELTTFFSAPANREFRSYELAIATRMVKEEEETNEAPVADDDPFADNSTFGSQFLDDSANERFQEKLEDMARVISNIGKYILDGNVLDQYDVFVFPEDAPERSLAGRAFVLDAIVAKSGQAPAPNVDPKRLFDYDEETPTKAPEGWDEVVQADFGLLLLIEISKKELKALESIGPERLVQYFKARSYWPFYDDERAPLFSC